MKETRFYKAIIAVLILINVATLTFMWFGRPPQPPFPNRPVQISNVLGLKGDAKIKIDSIEKAHHASRRELMQDSRKIHEQIYEQMNSETPPTELLNELDRNNAEAHRITYEFFKNVATYCDDEQKEQLQVFIKKTLFLIIGGPNEGHRTPRRLMD